MSYNMTMNESDPFPDPPKNLAAMLAEVGREIGYVQKDGTNTFHKYKYASAESILKKANEALFGRGIAIQSNAELLKYEVGSDFKDARAVVKISLTFIDSHPLANRALQVEGIGEGMDKGDKAVAKANTSAIKYALANAFLISWGDDPEADASTDANAAPKNLAPKVIPISDTTPTLAGIDGCSDEDAAAYKRKIVAAKSKLNAEDYSALTSAFKAKFPGV